MGELHVQMHTMMRGGKSQGLLVIFGYTRNVNLQSASARLGNLGMFLNLSINLTLFFFSDCGVTVILAYPGGGRRRR